MASQAYSLRLDSCTPASLLAQQFSTFLSLLPFNMVPHAVLTPNLKLFCCCCWLVFFGGGDGSTRQESPRVLMLMEMPWSLIAFTFRDEC